MSPEEHDQALAMTSHLPHAAAAALAAAVPETLFRLTGTGMLDATRVAAGDPELWRHILLQNRFNVLAALESFHTRLAAFHAALRAGDGDALEQLLTTAKKNRDAMGS
jgi:prephenate dehydrogenase